MGLVIVGSAEVRINADGKSFGPQLQGILNSQHSVVRQSGTKAGNEYGSGFNSGLTSSVRKAMQSAQREIGSGLNLRGLISTPLSAEVASANRAAQQQLRRGGRGLEEEAANSGRRTGSAFSKSFGRIINSDLGKAASRAADAFTVLYAKGSAMAAALGSGIGAVSTLVSGLGLLVGAAGSAASSLAAIGPALGAMIQGGIAASVAFKGVGAAISAGMNQAATATNKSTGASEGNKRSIVAAQRAIADARQRVAEVVIQNAERMRAADERVADAVQDVKEAELDLLDAQKELLNTQRALTASRKEAREELQQLAFSAEDAALAEERAGLNLEDAYAQLKAVQNLPADNKTRREAELSFKESELNYRQAKDRAADLGEEQAAAAQKGIAGTKAYQSAQKDVADAQKGVLDAQKGVGEAEGALADARAERSRVAAQNARDLAKAHQAVKRAQQDAAAAAKTGAAATTQAAQAVDKYAEALEGLSPSAQRFVRYMVDNKKMFNEFKQAVQEPFFAKFTPAFEDFSENVLGDLADKLGKTSAVMGDFATQILGMMTVENLGPIMDQNTKFLKKFTTEGKDGTSAVEDLVNIFFKLYEAISPLANRFGDFLVDLLDSKSAFLNTEDGLGSVTDFFNRAGDRMAVFFDIFKSITGIFGTVFKAAEGPIDNLLNFLKTSFGAIDRDAKKNIGGIGDVIWGVVENLKPLLKLVGKVGLMFLKMGGAPELGETFKTLQGALPYLQKILDAGADAGPSFAKLVVSVVKLFSALADSGSLKTFFDTLTKISDVVNTLIQSGWVAYLLKFSGPILAAVKAVTLFGKGLKLIGKIGLGGLINTGKQFGLGVTSGKEFIRGYKSALSKAQVTGPKVKTPAAAAAAPASRLSPIAPAAAPAAVPKPTAANRVGGVVGKATAGVGKATAAATKQGMAIGKATSDGIAKGVSSAQPVAKIQALSRSIISAAKGVLKIKSPSLVMVGVGEDVGEGMAKGIAASQVEVNLAAKKLAAGAVSSAKTGAAGAGAAGGAVAKKAVVPDTGGAMVAQSGKFSGAMSKAGGAVKGFASVAGVAAKGLGKAFSLMLGPVGMIAMIAIPLLIDAFKYLYNNSEGFRKFIDGIVAGFKSMVAWLVDVVPPALQKFADFFKAVWGGIKTAFSAVVTAIKWFWDNVLFPPINLYIQYLKFLWSVVILVWDGIKAAISLAMTGIQILWTTVLKPVVDGIVFAFQWLWEQLQLVWLGLQIFWSNFITGLKIIWDTVGQPLIDFVVAAFNTMVGFIVTYIENLKTSWGIIIDAIVNVWNKTGAVLLTNIQTAWSNLKTKIGELLDAIKKKFSDIVDGIKNFWANTGAPIVDGILKKWSDFKTSVITIFDDVKTGFTTAINAIKTWWTSTGGKVLDTIETAFDDFKDGVVAIWDKVKDAPKTGIHNMIKNLNKWLVEPLNKLTKKFSVTIPDIPDPTGLAEGGPVEGVGGPKQDNQLRRLSVGEYVVQERSVSKIGKPVFDYINKNGMLPAMGTTYKKVVEPEGGLISDGAAWLAKKAGDAMDYLLDQFDPYLPNGKDWISDALNGIWDVFKKAAVAWATGEQKKADKALSDSGGPAWETSGDWGRPTKGGGKYHNWSGHNPSYAADSSQSKGTSVYAIHSGSVTHHVKTWQNDPGGSYGAWVTMSHPGTGYSSLYGHLSAFKGKTGKVAKGARIALSGNSGNSGGPHVHFELKGHGRDTVGNMKYLGIRLASGGTVLPTPDGIQAILGEGGRPERVEPLDSQGLSVRDRALIRTIVEQMAARQGVAVGGGGATVVRVYIGNQELKDLVRYEISDGQSTLAKALSTGRRRP